MDLSSLKPTERKIEIKHPGTGEPIGIRVNIVSIDDDRLKSLKREIQNERLRLESKGKTFKVDQIEHNQQRLLFTATTGWEWYNPTGAKGDKGFDEKAAPTFNGEVPTYNEKNFKAVITDFPWFADQLNEEIGETKAFFTGSKPS